MADGVDSAAEFGAEDAARPDALLAAVFPADAIDYESPPGWLDAAGFLFAVACAPEPVPVAEWLEALLTPPWDRLAPVDPESQAAVLLQRLYSTIAAGVASGAPQPPSGWEPRPEPLGNFASAAPLAQWARGFQRGHWWLADDWDVRLPASIADALDACYGALVFFADPDEAAGTVMAASDDPQAADEYAGGVIEGFATAMCAYAAIGAVIGESKVAAALKARDVAARQKKARRHQRKAQKRSRKANRR